MLSNVLFPAPFFPDKSVMGPGVSVRWAPRSAGVGPNSLVNWRAFTTAMAVARAGSRLSVRVWTISAGTP